jgi:4-amino-4-deoxy-L-arabinose transferase-like glycosyltransferase
MLDQLYTFLTASRLVVAVVNSLGIVLIFWLVYALYGRIPAILVAALLALDPFVVGLSGLLHVDSLMTTFVTISLITFALSLHRRQTSSNRHFLMWAALSGVTAGLATLNKTPALLLPPFVCLFLFLSLFSQRTRPFKNRLGPVIALGLVWVGSCLLTIFLLFPALWVSPVQVAHLMSSTSNRHIEEALRPSFFLGELAFDKGPLFYPLIVPLRLSPVTLSGLILALFLIVRALFRRKESAPWNRLETWIFILWPFLFLVGISVAAKKFDRYALPAIPALIIVASLGWANFPVLQTRLKQAVAVLVVVQFLFLAWAMPYPLTAVNPLLGGQAVAQRVFDVGWGEAEGAAARWLAAQPGTENQTAVTWNAPALAPLFPGQTLPPREDAFPHADYIIVLTNGRETSPPGATLLHTIRFNGMDRAAIYTQPVTKPLLAPEPLPVPVTFGSDLNLLAAHTAVQPDTIQTALRWQLPQHTDKRYTVRLALRDAAGYTWAALESPLLNDIYLYPEHWPEGETTDVYYDIPLPPGLPPDEYQLEVVLFNAANQAQLTAANTADGTVQGMAQPLGSVTTILPPQPPAAYDFDPPILRLADWTVGEPDSTSDSGRLRLLNTNDFPPSQVITGDDLLLDLYWLTSAELPAGLQVEITVGDLVFAQPLSRYDTSEWRPGELIHEKTAVPIPATIPGGVYPLSIRPLTADGQALGERSQVGQVELNDLDRVFTLPPDIPVLHDDEFGGQMGLHGLNLHTPQAAPGQPVNLTLYWQVAEKPADIISAFVHLIDANGEIVAQSDQWPGGLPANYWAEGQVIVDEHTITLPAALPPGEYRLSVGLYAPANGQRLFLVDGSDALTLPVTVTIAPETAP